jgi:hypothetical protein
MAGMESANGSSETKYGIALLVIITILMFGALLCAKKLVEPTTKMIKYETVKHRSLSSFHISGQTTLAQAAKIGGISVEELILQLNLPSDVDVDERLGRLKRQYGFEIHDVRRILEQAE